MREWNANVYHRVSNPQFDWGLTVLERLPLLGHERVLDLGACNAILETGISSPLDDAIAQARHADPGELRKVGEIPFDFVRKRVTVIVEDASAATLIAPRAVPLPTPRRP